MQIVKINLIYWLWNSSYIKKFKCEAEDFHTQDIAAWSHDYSICVWYIMYKYYWYLLTFVLVLLLRSMASVK